MDRIAAAKLLKANLKSNDLDTSPLYYSTGCLPLDAALGGGWPAGLMSQISGAPDVGKTTLLLHTIAAAQKIHERVYMITFDMNEYITPYWTACGVDLERLWLLPGWSDTALSEDFFPLGDFVVADSIPGQAEADRVAAIQREDRTIVAVVQERVRLSDGLLAAGGTTTHNLPYKALSVKLSAAQRGMEGFRVYAEATSHRHWPPANWTQATWHLNYGRGIDREAALLDMGVQEGIVLKSGNWYGYSNWDLGQGRTRAAEHLRRDPELAHELESAIRLALGLPIPAWEE